MSWRAELRRPVRYPASLAVRIAQAGAPAGSVILRTAQHHVRRLMRSHPESMFRVSAVPLPNAVKGAIPLSVGGHGDGSLTATL